jgi:hypothetical protein
VHDHVARIGQRDDLYAQVDFSVERFWRCQTVGVYLYRLDEDQCARRNAQKYLKVVDPDYYEMEAHIFMDDAFDINEYGEPVVNKFVHQLIEKMGVAAT